MNSKVFQRCVVRAFVSVGAILGCVTTASALPIYSAPDGTTTIRCSTGLTTSSTSGPIAASQSCIGSAIWHDSADANLAALTVTAGSTNDGPSGLGGFPAVNESFASISYYVNVVAGAFEPGVFTVPLIIDAQVQGMIDGGGFLNSDYAIASVKITDPFSKQLFFTDVECFATSSCSGNHVVTMEQTIDVEILNPFNQLLVTMRADAQYGSNAPSTVFASADPLIQIDPAFLALHPDYYLVFSSNIVNGGGGDGGGGTGTGTGGTSVPEPGSILLMCVGLLSVGAATRRRVAK